MIDSQEGETQRVLRSQSRREEEEGEQLTGDNNNTGERTESGSVPRMYGATYEECCTSRSDYTTSPLLPPSAGGLLRSGGTARAAELPRRHGASGGAASTANVVGTRGRRRAARTDPYESDIHEIQRASKVKMHDFTRSLTRGTSAVTSHIRISPVRGSKIRSGSRNQTRGARGIPARRAQRQRTGSRGSRGLRSADGLAPHRGRR